MVRENGIEPRAEWLALARQGLEESHHVRNAVGRESMAAVVSPIVYEPVVHVERLRILSNHGPLTPNARAA